MLGLKVYSYVDINDSKFYKAQKLLAKKMDVLDWIPGSYAEEIVEGGESPQDRARRVNPAELAMIVPYSAPEPLATVHPGSSSRMPGDEEEEEEEEDAEEDEEEHRVEGEVEEGATGFTQESEAPSRKKAMRVATPQSKLVPVLTVDDARDMFSRDATATFRERRKIKGKKLYSDYAVEETIAISSEDEDDRELAKRLRSDPPSPGAFAGMVMVKPEVLTVEEANEKRLREEEQRLRLEKATAEEPSVRNEVAELRALLMEQDRLRAMAQPASSADLITQVIQGMMAQGLMVAPPGSFPHLPPNFPPQSMHPQQGSQGSFSFQHMVGPHVRPYAPVQQVDDPNLWRLAGSSRPLTPPPLRPPLVMPPHHQSDDPHMFGSSDPNPAPIAVPPGPSHEGGEFGSGDRNQVAAQSSVDQHESDTPMHDVEGPQRPGDTSTPVPIDETMHVAHAEVGLGDGPDTERLQARGADLVGEGGGERGGPVEAVAVETSMASRQDQAEVIH